MRHVRCFDVSLQKSGVNNIFKNSMHLIYTLFVRTQVNTNVRMENVSVLWHSPKTVSIFV